MKHRIYLVLFNVFLIMPLFVAPGFGQTDTKNVPDPIRQKLNGLEHRLDVLEKAIDDVLWYHKVGDVAFIDKVRIYGPPPAHVKNPNLFGATNPVKFYAYVFIPKNLNPDKKYPLLVFPHGGVHANFTTYYTHIVRELMAQGYIVIAPEYRGSTGYGEGFYKLIDYGGLEIEDAYYSRNYMIENYPFVDEKRVGIIGWSHGGLITLMNIFHHPDAYQAAFAGVPVSDLVARMGYYDDEYRSLYEADYHIGASAHENVEEYRRRSPVWNVEKFQNTPLLIHTNTNDEDVHVLEVEHLIRALKAAGKKFEYEIFQDAPGGHSFDRMDTMLAKKARLKIYAFLSKYLNPPSPMTTMDQLMKASYYMNNE